MVNGVDASRATYETWQIYVIAFALAGFLLTLALGYAISWSIVGPVRRSTIGSIVFASRRLFAKGDSAEPRRARCAR